MTVQRYRQMPAELDGLQIDRRTITEAVTWLAQYGRDGYEGTDGLRVAASTNYPAFDVPFGDHLVRDPASGGFAPVPADQLRAERYAPVGQVPVPMAPPPRPGQPGHRL